MTKSDSQVYTVKADQSGQRLDVWCVSNFSGFSRAALQRAIKEGAITVNGKTQKPRYSVQAGDQVSLIAVLDAPAQEAKDVEPVKLQVLYEDPHVVVVNKPPGLAVHPGQGNEQRTVSHWFIQHYPGSIDVGDHDRPGIVHRLDKDTSGVLIMAKIQQAFDWLKQEFKQHRARKEYLALVFGVPGEPKGRITRPLQRSKRNPLRRTVDPEGKPAITEWRFEEKYQDSYALLRVYPLTGRTHQIRVHLHFLGFPIVGDQLYTFRRQKPPAGVKRQLLHAEKLTVMLPSKKRKSFVAPLPDDFEAVIEGLKS